MLFAGSPVMAEDADEAPAVVAVLPLDVEQADLEPLAALLEQQLADESILELVERAQVNALLDEQQLDLLMAAGRGEAHMRIGELLRADLLVLLMADAEDPTAMQFIVSETRQGLRVVTETVTLTNDLPGQSEAMATLVREAAHQVRQPPKALLALPTFTSSDLTYEQTRHGGPLALTLGQALRNVAGLWFIELDEARAVLDELRLSDGEPAVERALPIIVLGSYRHDDTGNLTLTIELRQGDQVLTTLTSEALQLDDVESYLRETVAPRVTEHAVGAASAADARADADQLARRASTYVKLGLSDEAFALTEASLLVDPRRLGQRVRALRLISSLVPATFGEPDDRKAFDEALARAITQWQLGQVHFNHVVHQGLLRQDDSWADGESQWWALVSDYVFATEAVDAAWRHLEPNSTAEQTEAVLGSLWAQRRAVRERLITALERHEPDAQPRALVHAVMTLIQVRGPRAWGESSEASRAVDLRCLRAIAGRDDVLAYTDPNVLAEDPSVRWTADDVPYLKKVAKLPSEPLRERAERLLARIAAAEAAAADATLFARLQTAMNLPDPPLQKLVLEAHAADGSSYPVFPTGWLACGDDVDLVWERHRRNAIYLMREPVQLERIARFDLDTPWKPHTGHTFINQLDKGHGLHHPCFDGRYIWAPIAGPDPLVLVVEPGTCQTWRLTADAGLPPMNHGGSAVGIEPGVVCLTGSFAGEGEDQPLRAWVAIVRFDPGVPGGAEIDVIHEAVEQFHREAPEAVRWSGPDLGFRAGPIYRYTDSADQTWVVIWRRFQGAYLAYGPLWINIDTREVAARPRGPWRLSRRPAIHNGRLAFVTMSHGTNRPASRLMSFATPTDRVVEHVGEPHQPLRPVRLRRPSRSPGRS
ncbi:MAG: hypothetical protein WD534_06925 [Phycisphaeraceae bacterium]